VVSVLSSAPLTAGGASAASVCSTLHIPFVSSAVADVDGLKRSDFVTLLAPTAAQVSDAVVSIALRLGRSHVAVVRNEETGENLLTFYIKSLDFSKFITSSLLFGRVRSVVYNLNVSN